MSNSGINIELNELIRLKQYVNSIYRPQKSTALTVGQHNSSLRGRGMDFDEVRAYQAGDDIRHMEWRVTARTGCAHVKLYHEERERPVIIVVDFNPSMYFGTKIAFKSVIASKIAALLAWTAVTHGDRVGGVIFNGDRHVELKPKGRKFGVLPLLNQLSEFSKLLPKKDDARPLSDVLVRLRHVAKPGSLIFLISDFESYDDESERHISRMRLHADFIAYQVNDILEIEPPPPERYVMTDGKNEVIIDTEKARIRHQYQLLIRQKRDYINRVFTKYQIPLIRMCSVDDLIDSVRQSYLVNKERTYG
jgi:uncharacterized protein (DUF58 family)